MVAAFIRKVTLTCLMTVVTKNIRGKKTWRYKGRKAINERGSCRASSSLENPRVTCVRCHSSLCYFQWSVPELTCDMMKVKKSKARFMACMMKSLCSTEMSGGEATLLYYKTKRLPVFRLEQLSAASCQSKFCFVILIFFFHLIFLWPSDLLMTVILWNTWHH